MTSAKIRLYFLKGVRRYPLGSWKFRENPEIIRGHSNVFPGSKKSRQPNLWRPSSLPLCDDSPFELKKKTKKERKNGLPFFKWAEELIEPNWRRCFLTTRSHCILAWNWGWKEHKSPSHAHAVQLFSHCFLGFDWVTDLASLVTSWTTRNASFAKPSWTNWKTSTQKVVQKSPKRTLVHSQVFAVSYSSFQAHGHPCIGEAGYTSI